VDHKHVEFNTALLEAFDQTISDLLGTNVLSALYDVLARNHDISRDELPYRLDTAFKQLEQVFGVKGAKTIGRAIATRLYGKLGLEFESIPNLGLDEYIQTAKNRLAQKPTAETKGC
jgi:hypothetical protein